MGTVLFAYTTQPFYYTCKQEITGTWPCGLFISSTLNNCCVYQAHTQEGGRDSRGVRMNHAFWLISENTHAPILSVSLKQEVSLWMWSCLCYCNRVRGRNHKASTRASETRDKALPGIICTPIYSCSAK